MRLLPRRSLFLRLFGGFLFVMSVVWLGVLGLDVYETQHGRRDLAQSEIQSYSQHLLAALYTVADRPDQIRTTLKRFDQKRLEVFKARDWYAPALQVQVWRNGTLLYSQGVAQPEPMPHVEPGQGRPKPMPGALAGWVQNDAETGLTVQLVQEVVGSWMFTLSSMGYYLLPLLVCIPILVIPAGFMVWSGLRPLNEVRSQIERRSAADLSPLPEARYKELKPIVAAVNQLMQRLAERLAREKEFLVDAAHELKTPLAVVQLNADALATARDPSRLDEARQGLLNGVARATHTVHQLLALERSGGDAQADALKPLDLVELVRDRLAVMAEIAHRRGIEIELHANEACVLPLHRESAASLIDNLVDNAVKYSPDGSTVVVSVVDEVTGPSITVIDQGPGIPQHLRARAFERFFRLPDQDQTGSGLGLSIAERAAARNRASIRLDDGPGGVGLQAIVQWRLLRGLGV
ncbi:ATP-binding protein [Piscinibacter terrae]|uniref:histidine kinase n=1 Tax=Piscinibacter terrae TaxID=2496871 RepID=A0A3N7HNT4_9BURK|nr:ATP-binding protein [Albitalea terrae]RQP23858.1 two-component sensor histidine kinase [Albitalea terrae]